MAGGEPKAGSTMPARRERLSSDLALALVSLRPRTTPHGSCWPKWPVAYALRAPQTSVSATLLRHAPLHGLRRRQEGCLPQGGMPGRPALAPHHARASAGASRVRHVKRPKSEEGPRHRLLRSYWWVKLCGLTPTSDTQSVCVVFNGSLGRCVALRMSLDSHADWPRPRKKRAQTTSRGCLDCLDLHYAKPKGEPVSGARNERSTARGGPPAVWCPELL